MPAAGRKTELVLAMGRGGTGLGLSIVHGLVTQGLGGQITVDYGQAQGTGFIITLPKSDPRPPRHAELDSELPDPMA